MFGNKKDNFVRIKTIEPNQKFYRNKIEMDDVFKIKTGKTLRAIRKKNQQSQKTVGYLLEKDQS